MPAPSRALLVAAARGWLGTPFQHQASVRQVGCDCVGLIRGVALELDLAQGSFDDARYRGYARVPSPGLLLRGLGESLTPIKGGLKAARPGDILLFRIDDAPQHLALRTEVGMLHAYARKRRVVEHVIDDTWQRRFVSAWCLPELADQ